MLFQIFGFLTIAEYTIWLAPVLYAPNSISQYLPYEFPINLPTIIEITPFVAILGIIAYLSLRGSKKALLASLIYTILILALSVPTYVSPGVNKFFFGSAFSTVSLPSIGDTVFFTVAVIIVVLDGIAYRSFPSAKSS